MAEKSTPIILWMLIPFLAFGIGIHLCRSGWVALVLYHLLLAVALYFNRRYWSAKNLLEGFSLTWFLIHLLVSAVAFFAFLYLASLKLFTVSLSSMGNLGVSFVVYFLLINPILEEIFWRDLFATSERNLSLGDIIFGVFHVLILQPFLPWNYIIGFVIGLIAIAYLWRQLRWRYQGLAIPWSAHFLGDTLFVLLVAKLI